MATYTDRVHLAADTLEELREIGNTLHLTHYDGGGFFWLMPKSRIQKAIDHGVKVVSTPELLRTVENLKHDYQLRNGFYNANSCPAGTIIETHFALYGHEHPHYANQV
jgi:hypothetical protein